ncbi:putative MFS transporter, partial [Aspergillus floccosus]
MNDSQGEDRQADTSYSHFRKYERIFIIAMAALASLMSPISSQIYYPALPVLSDHYRVSDTLINLSVTVYMIIQGLAPSFMSSFADTSGRRPVYITCFLIYAAANIGLALQDTYPALMGLRCIQSAGSSATTSLGYGVAADIASPSQRGKYMGLITAGLMTALSLGPILGGLLVQWLGWRSIFWFLVILSGSYLVIYVITMPETSRKVVTDRHRVPRSWWRKSLVQHITFRRHDPPMTNVPAHREQGQSRTKQLSFNPLRSLTIFRDKAASIVILHIGLSYALQVAIMTNMANTFGRLYHLNAFKLGLCFLPLGVAGCASSMLTGVFTDLNYRRIARKTGDTTSTARLSEDSDFPVEKVRLQVALPLLGAVIASLIPYGWVLSQDVPLYAPLILQGVIGFCGTGFINILSALLVDFFPEQPSTASAAANLVRCWLSAVLAAVLEFLISGMGLGWCFTFFGLVVLAASPLLCATYWFGVKWRTRRISQTKPDEGTRLAEREHCAMETSSKNGSES